MAWEFCIDRERHIATFYNNTTGEAFGPIVHLPDGDEDDYLEYLTKALAQHGDAREMSTCFYPTSLDKRVRETYHVARWVAAGCPLEPKKEVG